MGRVHQGISVLLVSAIGVRADLSLTAWLVAVLAVDLDMRAWTGYVKSVTAGRSLLLMHQVARYVLLGTIVRLGWLSVVSVATARRW